MSLRDDLQVAWALGQRANDAARHGHDLCSHAGHHDCTAVDRHAPRSSQQRAAPSLVGAGAHAMGHALVIGAVLARFFAFVAPLIVRYYVWRLWSGSSRRRIRTGDRPRLPVAVGPATRGTPSGGHAEASEA
jgi:hypothetical protein